MLRSILKGFELRRGLTKGFARIAEAIKSLNRPTLLVQEGGYICDALADNLTNFLDVFTA